MKKLISILISFAVIFCFCGCEKKEASTNKGTLSVCLASEPSTLDPALNSTADAGTLLAHLFSGLAKWTQDSNGKMKIVSDCAKSLSEGVVNADGSVTYTYELKDNLLWSDGKALTSYDFVFAWNRAASPELSADYHHMFDVISGYDKMWETKEIVNSNGEIVSKIANPDAKLNMKVVDARTFQVTLKNKISYWNELLAFPVFYPVREDIVGNESWATTPKTYVSNGPYILTDWVHNSVITVKKNQNYHNISDISMDVLKFYLSDDSNNMLANYKNGDWLFIDDVPTNEIESLQLSYPNEFFVKGQLGTYYLSWNINADILPKDSSLKGADAERAKAEIRKALSLLLDRNYIVKTIGQAGQIPASSFVSMGLTSPDGTEFYKKAGNSDSFYGYYDVSDEAYENNYKTATKILSKYYDFDAETQKFMNVPTLTYIYNTSDTHQAMGEYIQGAFSAVGISVELVNQEWNTFLNTRKQGEYTLARNGWLADYNDPISFLDMWTSDSGNNDIQFGKGNNAKLKNYSLHLRKFGIDVEIENGTWTQTYDRLILEIKNCTDNDTRYQLMHLAEDMLMESGCITPIFFYTDIYMLDDSVSGFYSNPLGFKFFMHCKIN